jgi:hypothetical protein
MSAGADEPTAPDGPADPDGEPNRTGGRRGGSSATRSGAEASIRERGSTRTSVGRDGSDGAATEPGPDDTFEALSNRRRRYALHYLGHGGDETADVRTVAEHVAAWEYGKPIAALERAERKRVRTALRQFHLPKLDTLGFVEYDERRGEVRLRESASELDVYADVVSDRSVLWGPYYVCLGCLGGAALLAARTGVAAVGAVPTDVWAGLFVGAVLLSGLVHSWYESRSRLGVGEEPPELRT